MSLGPRQNRSAAGNPPQGEPRRILARLETPSLRIEEVEYAAGFCVGLHSHETVNLIYILDGAHWSGYSRGGDECLPRTVRLLPAHEPHENYFPVRSTSLHVELRSGILDLAYAQGARPG